MSKPHAIIVGAGFTGVAIAYDLALRGFDITVVDRGPIVNGTSGRTHGLLHCGARYAVKDRESAIECIEENTTLRKIVPDVIEPNGGLFVGINDDDLEYGKAFETSTAACHIQIEELKPAEALRMEPNLNPKLVKVYRVPDGTFDPLRLALAFAASAKAHGAKFRLYTEVTGLTIDGKGNVTGIKVWDRTNDRRYEIRGDMVVNATGAWAGQIAKMANVEVPVTPTPGVMVAYDQRLTQLVVNRLNKPGDGDIILPQRRMLVVGTTSFEVTELDYVPVYEDHIKMMLERARELIPPIANAKMRGAYMATRPLIGATAPGRSIARTFRCYDHKEDDGVDGIVSITGGKATTLRLMAEALADLVCQKMGISAACATRETKLVSYRQYYALPD